MNQPTLRPVVVPGRQRPAGFRAACLAFLSWCLVSAALVHAAPIATTTIGFNSVSGAINNYYNGGTDAAGNSGPNVGITSTFPAVGGWLDDQTNPTLNVPSGFTTGFAVVWNVRDGMRIRIFDGLDGSGTQLATQDFFGISGTASLAFSGTAKSVRLERFGQPDFLGYDNLTFGSTTIGTPVSEPPAVTTSAATGVTSATATLNATINPAGTATTAQFEYGTTPSYGSTASVNLSPNDGTSAQTVSANLSGLAASTTYYYRATAVNGVGTRNGSGLTFTTAAPPGKALHFDGSNDQITVPHSAALALTTPFTVETWIKPEATAEPFPTTFSKNGDHLVMWLDGTRIDARIGGVQLTGPTITFGVWTHVALTYDGVTGRIYKNGMLAASGGVGTPAANSNPFYLGYWQGYGRPFRGAMDEFRVWTVARTAQELLDFKDTELATMPSSLVLYFKLNQGVSGGNNTGVTTAVNETGGPNGTLNDFGLSGTTGNWINGSGIAETTSAFGAPDINLKGGSPFVTIPDGTTATGTANDTDLGSALVGTGTAKTFTLENTGNSSLTVSDISFGGANPDDYAVSGITLPATVAPNSSTTFTVTFTPTEAGVRTATVNVISNDSDESNYDFALTGTGTLPPATALHFDGVNDSVDIPHQPGQLGYPFTVEAWVKTTDTHGLLVSKYVASSGNGWQMGTEGGKLTAWFFRPGGAGAIFPSGSGIVGATTINDGLWHHVAFVVDSTGGRLYVDGVSDGFSGWTWGTPGPATTTAPVRLGDVTVQTAYPFAGTLDEVRIWAVARSAAELLANRDTELAVMPPCLVGYYKLNHGTVGANNAGVNSAVDEIGGASGTLNNFALSGLTSNWTDGGGITSQTSVPDPNAPDINLTGNTLDIALADTTPRPEDDTDFGNATVLGSPVVRSFTVQNTGPGASALNVSGISVTGTHAANFTAGTLTPPGPIAGGGSATFTVTFSPSAAGLRSATVTVNNDDCNESAYSFAVQGTGVNTAPTVTRSLASITSPEGSTAANSGTFSDAQGNATVTLSASVGTITQDNGLGTWSWSYSATDGPDGPTTVTITATDNGSPALSSTVTFGLTVNNVAPKVNQCAPPSFTLVNTSIAGWAAAPGDLDGDGDLDIVMGYPGGGISPVPFRNNGNGTFTQMPTLPGAARVVLTPLIADFNGDGKLDVAVDQGSSYRVYFGNGALGSSSSISVGSGGSEASGAVADLNADGRPDLVIGTNRGNSANDGNVSIRLNNGSGGFPTITQHLIGPGEIFVATADFNGDGKPDIAAADSEANTVTVLLNNGAGAFTVGTSAVVGTAPKQLTTGDVNNDGFQDIIAPNSGSGTVSVLLGNGTGGFAAASSYAAGAGAKFVLAADFNNDSVLDLGVALASGVALLPANGGGTFGAPTAYGVGFTPINITLADMNADGGQDILVGFSDLVRYLRANVAPATVAANEGSTAANSGTFCDPGADTVTITATLGSVTQNNGAGTWSWSYPTTDGPAQNTPVTITATDSDGATSAYTFNLVVANLNPTATFANGGAVSEGGTGSVTFSSPADAGAPDTSAGFHYAYDFNNDGTFDSGDGTYAGSAITASATVPATYLADGAGSRVVIGRILDKDGGFTDYTTTITINNVAPTIAISGAATVPNGTPYTLNLGAITDPGTDTASAFSINWGDGNTENFTGSPASTTKTHTYASVGIKNIAVALTDEDGTHASAGTTTVTVENTAPTVARDAATVTVPEGTTAFNSGTFADANGDTVTITASVGTITQSGAGTWTHQQTLTQGGSPIELTLDSQENLYVANEGQNKLYKYDSSGSLVTSWTVAGNPTGVAVDSVNGWLYVALKNGHRVDKFTLSGTFLTTWGSAGSGNGQFSGPHCVAVDAAGDVYVADSGNNRIQVFSPAGAFLRKWGSAGSGNGQFNFPQGLRVSPGGTLYVADRSNNRVQYFDTDGNFLGKWGSAGSGNGQFNSPAGIGIDPGGNVVVGDIFNSRIQKFTDTGTYVDKLGPSTAAGNLALPHGTAFPPSGRSVYIADFSNGRVVKFATPGGWNWSYTPADGAAGPTTVTITATDNGSPNLSSTTTFTLNVNNVAPTIALTGDPTVANGTPYTLNLGAITDPGADTVSAFNINWGDGNTENFTGNPASTTKTHTYVTLGAKTVTVTLTDGDGTFTGGTWSVTVENAAPVATADGLNRPNTTTVAKVLKSALLANDSDADSDPLTLTAVGNALPADATVTLAGNFVVYTAPANNAGNGSFTYTLSDGTHTVTGTVTVTETSTSGGGGGTPNYLTLVRSGDDFVVTFLGVPGGSFRVQYSTAGPPNYNWQEFVPQAIHTAAPNGVFTHTDINPPDPVRFYRAVSNP